MRRDWGERQEILYSALAPAWTKSPVTREQRAQNQSQWGCLLVSKYKIVSSLGLLFLQKVRKTQGLSRFHGGGSPVFILFDLMVKAFHFFLLYWTLFKSNASLSRTMHELWIWEWKATKTGLSGKLSKKSAARPRRSSLSTARHSSCCQRARCIRLPFPFRPLMTCHGEEPQMSYARLALEARSH